MRIETESGEGLEADIAPVEGGRRVALGGGILQGVVLLPSQSCRRCKGLDCQLHPLLGVLIIRVVFTVTALGTAKESRGGNEIGILDSTGRIRLGRQPGWTATIPKGETTEAVDAEEAGRGWTAPSWPWSAPAGC